MDDLLISTLLADGLGQNQDFAFVLLYILGPSILVLITAQFMFKKHTDANLRMFQAEIIKSNTQTITPLRLQAYERMALFLERSSIPSLIANYAKGNQSAKAFSLIASNIIREEYNHNVSQQIYLSVQLWSLIKIIKEQHLQMLQNLSASLPENATSTDLCQKLLEYLQSLEIQPQDRGLEFIKSELALLFG
ncbi:MAG: hypothetical protein CK532_01440 [Flavobacteriales bacterium]|nr:MAG: hypothetical protein CK532_01440 [Flavobacteriales bacterium]